MVFRFAYKFERIRAVTIIAAFVFTGVRYYVNLGAVIRFHLYHSIEGAIDGLGIFGSATAEKVLELAGRDAEEITQTVFRPEQAITRAEAVKIAVLLGELAGKSY